MDRIGALPLIVLAAMRGVMEWLRVYKHEYSHSQAHDLVSDSFAQLLFLGLAEALTALRVGETSSYSHERMVLHTLERDIPGITNLLTAADLGDDEAMKRAFHQITAKYGLPGFLDLAAMIPDGYNTSTLRPMFNSFQVSPHDVSSRLVNRSYAYR
jgi:hypothetical protein